ncbi:MAG: polyphosphate kinase 2 [Phenylobacterium sp.]|uniref:polyphosphate kinase 2 n=1 Tax=Phenylobacterium sp. TaxID=1871053 RepID=UPI00273519CC|nr:polyphosphate kinase 2 [Phenylobacterium sp.]MDP3173896.1 polyphosphate kinase 2 [Phenylobacterium sp.]
MSKNSDDDQRELERHQLALVHYQQHAMAQGERALIILEGRDAAGKDGTIRAVTEHLSVRNTRVIALAKPTEREQGQWYLQRYIPHLPAAGETVIFHRSWYNRGGVEPVMGFCTPEQHEAFLRDIPHHEALLVGDGLKLVKLWLDVSKKEQAKRLAERKDEPLKALKSSPLDEAAQSRWDAYTGARDEMLKRTHTAAAPWICVRSDHKKTARLNIIRHLVRTLAPASIGKELDAPDPDVLFPFEIAALSDGRLER